MWAKPFYILVVAGIIAVAAAAFFESFWAHSLIQFIFKDAGATGQLHQ